MKIITFGYHTPEVQSILYYGKYLIKEPEVFCLDTQFRNHQSPKYMYHLYEPGTYNIPYKNNNITLDIIRPGNQNSIELKGELFQYFVEITLTHDCSITLENFLQDADHFYKKNILMSLSTHDEIMIYTYKLAYHSWKKLKTIPTRNMDTLYLPDKKVITVDQFMNKEDRYRTLGIQIKYITRGIPGSGKTTLFKLHR